MQAISPIRPIRTDADLERALARTEEIFDAADGTPEGDELDVLADLVELYESKREPLGYPDPIAAIEFRLDQAELSRRDLVPLIGSSARVAEVLSRQRPITMPMARALHEHLQIPAEVLLREPVGDASPIDFRKFPLREMVKRGWVRAADDLRANAEQLVRELAQRAGVQPAAVTALYRKSDGQRLNAKANAYALTAWCWQVMAEANTHLLERAFDPEAATPEFLREVARLSASEDGPLRVRDFLREHGIALVIVPHVSRTYLDGATLQLADGRPVIGLTLRYDRVDNFWFTLLHELAHVSLHLGGSTRDAYLDDLGLVGELEGDLGVEEAAADTAASEALIPQADWESSGLLEHPSGMAVISLAQRVGVHPAVVAGRVRHETGNYRLLSHFVGTGQVRRQFEVPA